MLRKNPESYDVIYGSFCLFVIDKAKNNIIDKCLVQARFKLNRK